MFRTHSAALRGLIALPLVAAGVAAATPALAAHHAPARPPAMMHKTYTVQEMAGKSTTSDPTGYVFNPAKLTIKVGDSVMWVDKSMPTPHNIVGKGNTVINRTAINTSPYKVTFAKAGTYNYVCQIHPGMNGVVVVTK